MKRVLSLVLVFVLILVGCKSTNFINTKHNINDKDEAIIKEFRSHHDYSKDELKNLLTPSTSNEPKPEGDKSIIQSNTSEPFVGRINLDSETEKSFYGTWKVEKLIGFANSYNDASEYPTGQKVIGDEIIIKKDFYSTKGLKNYNVFQYELKNPLYNITAICYGSDSFYSLFKINLPSLNINDKVKYIGISDSSTKLGIPGSFFIVNNDRLILLLEATCFELKRVAD